MKTKTAWCLVGLLGLSLALCLVFVVKGSLPPGMVQDGGQYNLLAKNLLHDRTFPSAYRSPGYPVVIAGIYQLFGETTLPLFLFQAILATITVAVLFLLGRDIFGKDRPAMALIPAALIGLNPEIAAYSAVMLRECITMFLLVLSVFLCLRMLSRNWRYGIALGFSVAALAYIRQEACLLIFVMMALALLHTPWRGRDLIGGSLAVVIILGCTLPWVVYCDRTRGYANMQDALNSNLFCRTWYYSADGKAQPELRKYIVYVTQRNHLSPAEIRRYVIPPILLAELPEGDVVGEVALYKQLGQIARENLRGHEKTFLMDTLKGVKDTMGGYWLEWWKTYWEAPAFSENIRQGQWGVAAVKIINRVVWPVVVLVGCLMGVVWLWWKRDVAAWPMTLILIGTLLSLLPALLLVEGSPRLRQAYDGFFYLGMMCGLAAIFHRKPGTLSDEDLKGKENTEGSATTNAMR